jgi:hypothetical protein
MPTHSVYKLLTRESAILHCTRAATAKLVGWGAYGDGMTPDAGQTQHEVS